MAATRADDGTELSYEVHGRGRSAVLAMHGWAGSGRYFSPLLAHLDLDRWSVVTYDMRGHGRSAPSAGPLTLDRVASDALAVADAAGLDDFVLLGFSMSGKLAQYVALRAPDRVVGLVLVAGAPAGPLPLPPDMLEQWYACSGDEGAFASLIAPFMTAPVSAAVVQAFAQDAALVAQDDLRATMRLITDADFADRQTEVRQPTLLVAGAADPMLPPALLQGVADRLGDGRLHTLDCGHEIPIEKPAELARVVQDWLARLPGPVATA